MIEGGRSNRRAADILALPSQLMRPIALLGVVVFFTGAGISHFTHSGFFVSIVPPCLPAPRMLVYVSGVFEVLGGLGVLIGATRRWAAYGLLALLAAVFPANLHMALHAELFPDVTPTALYVRLPFQLVFAAWVCWATRPEPPRFAR